MIRNLNAVTFRGFGMLLPEGKREEQTAEPLLCRQRLELTGPMVPVWMTRDDTLIFNAGGNSVLSVFNSEGELFHFYLDKPVQLSAGVRFCLSTMRAKSFAELAARELPEQCGVRAIEDGLAVRRRIHVERIYTFFYQERERGFVFPGEEHSMLELTYVDRGALHSVVEGQDRLLEQGDAAIYGPDQWHMQYADMDVTASFVTITFDMAGNWLEGLLNRKFRIPQRGAALLQQMLRERDQPDPYSDDMVLIQLEQLLILLLREGEDAPETRLRTESAIHSENEIIRRAQQYIGNHLRERLTVPIVARHADVSPSYLTALFRKNLQISPGEYIRRIKLQESKQMIREGNLNFTEIAAALEYSTVHHFSRQFKEKFGITPTEYARSIR